MGSAEMFCRATTTRDSAAAGLQCIDDGKPLRLVEGRGMQLGRGRLRPHQFMGRH